jgi:hypothetical protein
MTTLAPLIPALKREVSGPGEFDADFPSSDDGELLGGLADAFGQAQLDGFFGTVTLDLVTVETDKDLSIAAQQLVVIYAGERILRSKLRNLNTKTLYKAGGVEYATENSAGAITQLLKDIQARKQQLLDQILRIGRAQNAVHVTDGYLIRSQGYFPLGMWGEFGGFFGYEIGGLGGSMTGLLF